MTGPITCFEHDEIHIGEEYLNEIDKINENFGNRVFKMTRENGKITPKATQYVGLINVRGQMIRIFPKIYRKDEHSSEEKQKQAVRNIIYMLNYARLNLKDSDANAKFEKFDDIFEVLINLFSKNLMDTIKKGFYKKYVTVEDNDCVLRGKLLIHKHIITNVVAKQKFYTEYDVFSENNALNHVFRFTVELLLKTSKNEINQKLLCELKFLLSDVDYKTVSDSDLKKIIFDRLNVNYKLPFNMAKMFIQRLWYPNYLMSSKSNEVYCFLIDMNQLFEDFLVYFIEKNRDIILPEEYQNSKIKIQKSERHLVCDENNKPVFELRPDLMLKEGNTFKLILDAKYKKLNPEDFKQGISQGDMYQVYAYATKYDCIRTILLYPEYEEYQKPIAKQYHTETKKIDIRTINLMMDLSKNQEEIKKCLKEIMA